MGKESKYLKTAVLWCAGQPGLDLGYGVRSCPELTCLQKDAMVDVEGQSVASKAEPGPAGADVAVSAAACY